MALVLSYITELWSGHHCTRGWFDRHTPGINDPVIIKASTDNHISRFWTFILVVNQISNQSCETQTGFSNGFPGSSWYHQCFYNCIESGSQCSHSSQMLRHGSYNYSYSFHKNAIKQMAFFMHISARTHHFSLLNKQSRELTFMNALDAFNNIPEKTKTAVIAAIISVVVFLCFFY